MIARAFLGALTATALALTGGASQCAGITATLWQLCRISIGVGEKGVTEVRRQLRAESDSSAIRRIVVN